MSKSSTIDINLESPKTDNTQRLALHRGRLLKLMEACNDKLQERGTTEKETQAIASLLQTVLSTLDRTTKESITIGHKELEECGIDITKANQVLGTTTRSNNKSIDSGNISIDSKLLDTIGTNEPFKKPLKNAKIFLDAVRSKSDTIDKNQNIVTAADSTVEVVDKLVEPTPDTTHEKQIEQDSFIRKFLIAIKDVVNSMLSCLGIKTMNNNKHQDRLTAERTNSVSEVRSRS
ncbi:hypothetical protein Cyrtocomes_00036 [Candidatus Cyrtobacter comes]|uniref:Uncharacterized protein n=1 Tax=Candidatus Cyrtobacter comes TaxID=675776 RepID=A0ABU5L727_9RICK|nr:hypothetical protein [Candidatus Cyrtobacter comes]MDZ5761680.1 hypothetical protein [Candidatus Cyrtobacter comes]